MNFSSLFASLAIIFFANSGCRQDSINENFRTLKPKPQANNSTSKTIKMFKAAEFAEIESEYTANYKYTTQEVQMTRERELVTKQFQQINRPILRSDFRQGSNGDKNSELFSQKNYGIVDILVVIDNSNSMAEEQVKLSTQLPILVEKIKQSDWRIAITTTDPKDGCIVKVINKDDSNPELSFSTAVLGVGTNGTGDESGFLQIANALDCKDQWLRPQSNLGILIVADEDNCSDGSLCADGTTESASIDYIRTKINQVRTLGVDARAYGIYWSPNQSSADCPSGFRPAYLYHELVRISQGTSGSICSEKFDSIFSQISLDLFNKLKVQFPLAFKPLPNTVDVFIDGESYTEAYQIIDNILVFPNSPKQEAQINVVYRFGENTIKSNFGLDKIPDPDTLQVSIDGKSIKSEDFALIENNIRFKSPPIELGKISIEYRELNALQTEFQLNEDRTLDDLQIKSTEQEPLAFEFDAANRMLTFKSPPLDGRSFLVSYSVFGSEKLIYPLLENSVQDWSSIKVRLKASNEEIFADINDSKLVISEDNFLENEFLVLTYREPGQSKQVFELSHEPVENSIFIASNNNHCKTSDFVRKNKIISTTCLLKDDESFKIKYQFVSKINNQLTIKGIERPENVAWQVYIDDLISSDFVREGNTIKLTKDAPVNATIQVVLSENL